MERRICAITGATGGIGAALADEAVRRGFDLVLHGRSVSKLEAMKEEISQRHPTLDIALVVGDLGTAFGAEQVAGEISKVAPKLDLLINNAGVLLGGLPVSPDGIDMHTQVNLIAPYVLMQRLKPALSEVKGSVINVASGSARRVKTLSVRSLKKPTDTRKLFGAYAQSKLAVALITQTIAPDFLTDGIRIVAADPGPVKSGMTSGDGMPGLLKLLRPFLYATPEKGAAKVFAALDSEARADQSGGFYPGGKRRSLPAFANQGHLADEILEFCDEQIERANDVVPLARFRISKKEA
ncbi:SDR family NAD(P)-dependent oxidoreductase [Octadecabacter sp. G9-8]|uniref:SDR family NAD(P)-dependent oxidoreductase n=1 Tax=Octadecabacter dasysiphoniae TaxID=2909341 RepID=A0ABS9CX13_9RHOB|nr:SDR family NAD(P)-dependent oxidoreductase [Octadecabacter dasysiphoniae]